MARVKAENSKKTVKKTHGTPFKPGNSGNPGGRPKIPEEVKTMARAASPKAMRALIAILDDENSRPPDIIRAAEAIINRAYGTPQQSIELTGVAGGPIGFRFVDPPAPDTQ